MDLVKKARTYTYIVAIIYFLVGLFMIINPSFVLNAVNYIIGTIVMGYGIIYIINLYQKKDQNVYNKFNFLAGVFCISFGLFLILYSDMLSSLIPFCAGIIIFMDSIIQIRSSFVLKKENCKKWWINLIVGLVFAGFSVYIILNAKDITNTIVRIIGIFLIVDSVMDFYTNNKVNHVKNEIKVIDGEVVKDN